MFFNNKFKEKEIDINGVTLTIRYFPKTGKLGFGRNEDSLGISLTNAGAFATLNAISTVLQDESLERIVYSAKGKTLRDMRIKERLYARVMSRLDYHLVKTYHNTYRNPFLWTYNSKKYVWEKTP
jgi:hypothetical protein